MRAFCFLIDLRDAAPSYPPPPHVVPVWARLYDELPFSGNANASRAGAAEGILSVKTTLSSPTLSTATSASLLIHLAFFHDVFFFSPPSFPSLLRLIKFADTDVALTQISVRCKRRTVPCPLSFSTPSG